MLKIMTSQWKSGGCCAPSGTKMALLLIYPASTCFHQDWGELAELIHTLLFGGFEIVDLGHPWTPCMTAKVSKRVSQRTNCSIMNFWGIPVHQPWSQNLDRLCSTQNIVPDHCSGGILNISGFFKNLFWNCLHVEVAVFFVFWSWMLCLLYWRFYFTFT